MADFIPVIPSVPQSPAETPAPGDFFYHCIAGFCEVLACEENHQPPQLKVRCENGDIQFVAWRVSKLSGAPMWPSDKVLAHVTFPLLTRTTTLRSWRQTAHQKNKRYQVKRRLDAGEVLGPLVEWLPLPWTPAAILRGPFFDPLAVQPKPFGRGRYRAGSSRGMPFLQAPRVVVGCVPSFRLLRGALAHAASAMQNASPWLLADAMANWPVQPEMEARVIELAKPLPAGRYQQRTQMFLNALRERMVAMIQNLRAKSHANGGWWPAPACLQLVLKNDGHVAARMCFEASYQAPQRPWLEWASRQGCWR